MTSDGVLVVRFIFSVIWRFFTSWHIPGTSITPAAWALFSLSTFVGLRMVKRYFLGGGDLDG